MVELFRLKGYSSTSLDDIARATKLTRPSLYGAFGDKQSMFLMAMDSFAQQIRETAGAELLAGKTLDAALSGFYEKILNVYYGDKKGEALGCLIFATAIAEAGMNHEIRDAVHDYLDSFAGSITNRIETLLPETPTNQRAAISTVCIATLHSLALRARIGEPRMQLERSINDTLKCIMLLAGKNDWLKGE